MTSGRKSPKKAASASGQTVPLAAEAVTSMKANQVASVPAGGKEAAAARREETAGGPRAAGPLKITAISVADAARVLSAAYGRRITAEMVREIAERGSLLRPDGTFNLVHYAAFLVREMGRAN